MVCFRYIIINILHKGGDDNYDDYTDNNNYVHLGCRPVTVVILHIYKYEVRLLLNLLREGRLRSV
jgi:hypothetical protein